MMENANRQFTYHGQEARLELLGARFSSPTCRTTAKRFPVPETMI
jgi:hypothetical protein